MRSLRRVLTGFLAAVVLLVFSACAYGLVIAPLQNDGAAKRLLNELLTELPPETEIVETAVWAGNSTGTGNHVEIWAGVLNRSGAGYSAEALLDCSGGADIRFDFPSTADPRQLFPALAAADSREGYFVYGRRGAAVTQWDLRGR